MVSHLSLPGVSRRPLWLVAIFATLLAGFSVMNARPAHAAQPFDWRIGGPGGAGEEVQSGTTRYHLFNTTINQIVAYGEREYGINLVWQDDDNQQNIRFDRPGGGTVRYGDVVAIRVSGGGYVKYGARDNGINLVWSNSPVYQWEIRGGTHGVPVRTDTGAIQLLNTHVFQSVTYGERDRGINLVWYGG
jgi:hypothetical protein